MSPLLEKQESKLDQLIDLHDNYKQLLKNTLGLLLISLVYSDVLRSFISAWCS